MESELSGSDRVAASSTGFRSRRLQLVILDDNPFLRLSDGSVHPRAALFHRFAEAVVATGMFAPATYLIPVRDDATAVGRTILPSVDPGLLQVVPTAPFAGIADYARRGLELTRVNWPIIRDAMVGADLMWIKAPASNAVLAALACRQARVPRFTWVTGSVGQVVASQQRGALTALAATGMGVLYDAATRLLQRTGPSVRLDASMFTSVVTTADVELTKGRRTAPRAPAVGSQFRLAWAGRVASEKGLDDLLVALTLLGPSGPRLDLIGDGPTRAALEQRASELALDDRVHWYGYLSDRRELLDVLRSADAFVLPSHTEGIPKVVVEAMAAGLPVIATDVGQVASLLGSGERGVVVPPARPRALADAIQALANDPIHRSQLADAGLEFATRHTAEAQALRLVSWLRVSFPDLPWLATLDAP